ncbi:hypothetical protein [Mammaliicoccus sciuri]|uniref:hypothetical protein n=1 Tax=Mammaliicoccus sciuri TaxID=1296 RepID=UPI0021CE6DAA|nr:hypothetical protein [Mammaliicoccus sciuri]UXV33330.1 hypothetical protein MUA60_06165 [Mammaliicoccus sciuri]
MLLIFIHPPNKYVLYIFLNNILKHFIIYKIYWIGYKDNENLRLENAYLKKLNAFRENPSAFLEKHKQQWHSNSKKKDSN